MSSVEIGTSATQERKNKSVEDEQSRNWYIRYTWKKKHVRRIKTCVKFGTKPTSRRPSDFDSNKSNQQNFDPVNILPSNKLKWRVHMAEQARGSTVWPTKLKWQTELSKREVRKLWTGIATSEEGPLHQHSFTTKKNALFFTYRREMTFCTRSPFVHNILRQKAFIVPHCKVFVLRRKGVIVLMIVRYFYSVKGKFGTTMLFFLLKR
jgi:hypothetical protein